MLLSEMDVYLESVRFGLRAARQQAIVVIAGFILLGYIDWKVSLCVFQKFKKK